MRTAPICKLTAPRIFSPSPSVNSVEPPPMSIMPHTPSSLAPMYESTASSSPETISTRAPQAASHRSVKARPFAASRTALVAKTKISCAPSPRAHCASSSTAFTEDCMLSSVSLPPISPANRRVPRRSRRTSQSRPSFQLATNRRIAFDPIPMQPRRMAFPSA